MDKGTIITTMVFIAIAILPFILTGSSRNRKKKELIQKMAQMATQNSCHINQYDFCGHFIIGMDTYAGTLFFFKKNENKENAQIIILKHFRSCKADVTSREIIEKRDKSIIIDKLELCFQPLDRKKKNEILEFYNNEYDSPVLSGELQQIRQWEKRINEMLRKNTRHSQPLFK